MTVSGRVVVVEVPGARAVAEEGVDVLHLHVGVAVARGSAGGVAVEEVDEGRDERADVDG